jgi:hypothetical protein
MKQRLCHSCRPPLNQLGYNGTFSVSFSCSIWYATTVNWRYTHLYGFLDQG